jgi:hypothetical protein
MTADYENDVIDALLDDEISRYALDDDADEGWRDYARRFRRWWTVLSAVRTLTGTDPVTHQPLQREVPVLPAPPPPSEDRRRNGRGQRLGGGNRLDSGIDDLLTEYLDGTDKGESSGPCYESFLWCMENSRRRNIPFGQSVCQACWDQCRAGNWPARVAGRMCPSPNRFRKRWRRPRA